MITTVAVVVLVAAVAVVADRYLRPQPQPAPLKPFGLEVFENFGFHRREPVVLEAVFATVQFLGHPLTVVEEAVKAKAAANTRAANAMAQIEEDRETIHDLQANIATLESMAKGSTARAGELDALVARVNSVVGSK